MIDRLRLVVVTPGRGGDAVERLVDRLFEPGDARGATALWLRERQLEDGALLELARRVAPRIHAAGAWLILAGRPELAASATADACHLGFRDPPPEEARALLADSSVRIGASRHDAPEAQAGAIDYCTLSPVYPTPKAYAAAPRPLGLERFGELCAALPCPVVGLGGIDAGRAAAVAAAGAVGVAVMRAITDADHPAAAARALRSAVEEGVR